MKLIAQITAGVFFGIALVFAVIFLVPKMIEERRAKETANQKLHEETDRITAIRKQIEGLTPEQLIARCGKPSYDDRSHRVVPWRAIQYDTPEGTVTLNYLDRGEWVVMEAASTLPCARKDSP